MSSNSRIDFEHVLLIAAGHRHLPPDLAREMPALHNPHGTAADPQGEAK